MIRWQMVSRGISSQTRIRASVSLWPVCGVTRQWRMQQYMMSQRYLIGVRSVGWVGLGWKRQKNQCLNCPGTTEPGKQQENRTCWGSRWSARVPLVRPSLTHCQTGQPGECCGSRTSSRASPSRIWSVWIFSGHHWWLCQFWCENKLCLWTWGPHFNPGGGLFPTVLAEPCSQVAYWRQFRGLWQCSCCTSRQWASCWVQQPSVRTSHREDQK